MANEGNRKVWEYGKNLFSRLNPDDISVAAKWPVITTGDINTKGLTSVVSPMGVADTSVCGMAGAASEAQHGVKPTVGLTAEQYEFVVYFRAGDKNSAYLENHTIANVSAYFNLVTGVVGTVGSACTAATKTAGNGWWSCSIRFTGTAAASLFEISAADSDGDKSFTGDGATVNVYVWRPGVYQIGMILSSEEDEAPGLRATDDGDLLIGGLGEDGRALPLNVSKANATRSTTDRVVLVQTIGADGAVGTGGGTVDLVKVLGTATAVNAGNLSAGVQRVTLCADGLVGNVTGTPGAASKASSFQVAGQDGTNLRTLLTDSAGNLYVQPAVVPTYEDSVNGWAKTKPVAHGTYTPSPTTLVLGAAAAADVLAPLNILGLAVGSPRIWVANDGANAVTAETLSYSPDGALWYASGDTTFAALGAGAALSLAIPNGIAWIKLNLTSASGTTIRTFVTGNY